MNDTPKAHVALFSLAKICREAAHYHGDDWHAVEKHIKKCVAALPSDQRERLATEMGRVLRFCAPNANARTQ